MQVSDKRVWRCRVCREEMTPRCPTCRVVIGQAEAEEGQCATCRTALSQDLANCPHCESSNSLMFSLAITYPTGTRGGLLTAGKAARTLVGLAQFIGLFLIALSFAGILTTGGDPEIANPVPIRGIGLALFFVPIPIQFALSYLIFRLRRVPVHIGDKAGRSQPSVF